MKVSQIYEILNNQIFPNVLGESATVLKTDLSNIIDFGNEIFNSDKVDNYVKKLIDVIGRVVVVDRVYKGVSLDLVRDGWEYGSILEKITISLPKTQTNQSWELEDGASYDPNIFYKPEVQVKFYNSKTTFEVPMSITRMQVRESFNNPTSLNAFVSGIYNKIEQAITISIDNLGLSLIQAMIAETLHDFNTDGDYSGTGVRAINVLKLYNDEHPDNQLTVNDWKNPEFVRFFAYQMLLYRNRLKVVSKLFNMGGTDKFTPDEYLKIFMLSDVGEAANVYLQSDTFHDEFTRLPKAEMLPYWQGTGNDYSFSNVSSINVKTQSGSDVNASGILAVMCDRDAMAICNDDRRVTSRFNEVGEFYNSWYKVDCSYLCDPNENFIVFYIA